jgi:hypothetical protein
MEQELSLLVDISFQSYTLFKGTETVLFGDLLSIILQSHWYNIPNTKLTKK